jgi:hypothetical protein
MSTMVDAKLLGGDEPDDNTYLAITVTNRGSAVTTLTNMVLYNYPSRLSLFYQGVLASCTGGSKSTDLRHLSSTLSECRFPIWLNLDATGMGWQFTRHNWSR